jgi:hypothetical protein
LRAAEEQVPALDVGADVTVPECGRHLPEVGHRDPVAPADVDAAQQGDVAGHLLSHLHDGRRRK